MLASREIIGIDDQGALGKRRQYGPALNQALRSAMKLRLDIKSTSRYKNDGVDLSSLRTPMKVLENAGRTEFTVVAGQHLTKYRHARRKIVLVTRQATNMDLAGDVRVLARTWQPQGLVLLS